MYTESASLNPTFFPPRITQFYLPPILRNEKKKMRIFFVLKKGKMMCTYRLLKSFFSLLKMIKEMNGEISGRNSRRDILNTLQLFTKLEAHLNIIFFFFFLDTT